MSAADVPRRKQEARKKEAAPTKGTRRGDIRMTGARRVDHPALAFPPEKSEPAEPSGRLGGAENLGEKRYRRRFAVKDSAVNES